jgi:hypothetical protein
VFTYFVSTIDNAGQWAQTLAYYAFRTHDERQN